MVFDNIKIRRLVLHYFLQGTFPDDMHVYTVVWVTVIFVCYSHLMQTSDIQSFFSRVAGLYKRIQEVRCSGEPKCVFMGHEVRSNLNMVLITWRRRFCMANHVACHLWMFMQDFSYAHCLDEWFRIQSSRQLYSIALCMKTTLT